MNTKQCKSCQEEKPLTEFFKDRTSYKTSCKTCITIQQKNYLRNYYYQKQKANRLLKDFGISQEEYNVMLKQQNELCAICGKSQTDNGRELAVDHCHKTGKVRALLCSNCNTGIGLFDESIESLVKSIEYLKRFK